MKHETKHILKKKGWTQQEIKEAESVIEHPRGNDTIIANLLFFSALVLIVAGNAVVSLVLIPFLLFLNNVILYVLITILAGIMGFLYNFIINDIRHLQSHHHLIGSVLIPLIAVANIFFIAGFSNRYVQSLQNQNYQNPYVIAVLFAVVFLLPYVIDRILKARKKNVLRV